MVLVGHDFGRRQGQAARQPVSTCSAPRRRWLSSWLSGSRRCLPCSQLSRCRRCLPCSRLSTPRGSALCSRFGAWCCRLRRRCGSCGGKESNCHSDVIAVSATKLDRPLSLGLKSQGLCRCLGASAPAGNANCLCVAHKLPQTVTGNNQNVLLAARAGAGSGRCCCRRRCRHLLALALPPVPAAAAVLLLLLRGVAGWPAAGPAGSGAAAGCRWKEHGCDVWGAGDARRSGHIVPKAA